jgi:hypothetical protein
MFFNAATTVPKSAILPEINLGFKNLLVSGCSFTYNNSEEHVITWPYYLRDLAQFENVFDCSCPGAGNRHIQQSAILALENNPQLTADNTLVIIMWSGYDRDDLIVDPLSMIKNYPDRYYYSADASVGMSGGLLGESNLITGLDFVKKIKNLPARALDNYVNIVTLYHYLKEKGFKFVFTEFSTPGTLKDLNFEITDYLEENLRTKFTQIVRTLTPNLGDYALATNQLSNDNYHLGTEAHLEWVRKILIPSLITTKDDLL